MREKTSGDEGYIVVETLFSFTMLIMVMVVIISLINIVAVQSRIHYAITQAAQEMSMYAYVTKCLSVDEEEDDNLYIKDEFKWVASTQDGLEELSKGITSFSNGIAAGITGFFIDDFASELMKKFAAAPNKEAQKSIMESEVKSIFVKYLCEDISQAESQTNDYLVKSGIYSLDGYSQGLNAISFTNSDGVTSAMLDSNGDTVVTVTYKIEFNIFNIIPLPLYLDVEQTVKTKAWLKGRTQK